MEVRRTWIEYQNKQISITRQCELLSIPRSSYYYQPKGESEMNLKLMKKIDKIYTKRPFYGIRKITHVLKREGYEVNHKRVSRLMKVMGIQAIYPKKKLSIGNKQHKIYPYLLRGLKIERVNQVWSSDITYIPMETGFIYLVAIMDWFSRYVLAWEVSLTLEKEFCIYAIEKALRRSKPEIFNSDQGSQFTSPGFLEILEEARIRISMDGRGRVFDNIFIERLWRTVKWEEVYLKDYGSVIEAVESLRKYFRFYNTERPHQSLVYKTPAEIYWGANINKAGIARVQNA